MSITVSWHDPQRQVILVKLDAVWDWQDMRQSIADTEVLLDSVNYPVFTLYECSEAKHIPPHALSNIRSMNRTAHQNQSKVAVVGLSLTGQSILNIFIKIYGSLYQGNNTRLVQTISDAYQFFGIEIPPAYDS